MNDHGSIDLLSSPLLIASPSTTSFKEDKNSTAAAVVALVKLCVGTGIMAMPWAFAAGACLSAPGMAAIGLWNFVTARTILTVADKFKGQIQPNKDAFSQVADLALGKPWGATLLRLSLIPVLFGVCASMQITAADLLTSVMSRISYTAFALLTFFPLIPLALQRNLRGAAFISGLALLTLFVGILFVVYYGLHEHGLASIPSRFTELPSSTELAEFYGVASFSFGFQGIILPVRDGMRYPSKSPLALALAACIVVFIYIVVGILGASLYWKDGVMQLMTLNLPPHAPLAISVKILSAASALLSYPITYYPLVEMLTALIAPIPESSKIPFLPVQTIRIAIPVLTTVVASRVPQFGVLAGLIGCLASLYAFLLPPLMHLRVVSTNRWSSATDIFFIALGLVAFMYPASLLLGQLRGDSLK